MIITLEWIKIDSTVRCLFSTKLSKNKNFTIAYFNPSVNFNLFHKLKETDCRHYYCIFKDKYRYLKTDT